MVRRTPSTEAEPLASVPLHSGGAEPSVVGSGARWKTMAVASVIETPHSPRVPRQAVSLMVACRSCCWFPTLSDCRGQSSGWFELTPRYSKPLTALPFPLQPSHVPYAVSSWPRWSKIRGAREIRRTTPFSYRYERSDYRLGNLADALTITSLRVAGGSLVALTSRAVGAASSLEIHDATFAATK